MDAADEFRLTSADGTSIACYRWESRGHARGVVQIAHGMGEHLGRYAELIEHLVAAGLVVYGNDHRGHGRSVRPGELYGDFGEGGFPALVDDMLRLSRLATDAIPDRPLVLLGHSMGSFAAQLYVLDHSHEIDGLVLSGTGALDRLAAIARSARPGRGSPLNAGFEPARTPFDWLSRDDAVVDAFVADPMCFAALRPAAPASLFAMAGALSNPARLREIRSDLPVYLFSGDEDPVGEQLDGVRVVIDRYRQAGLHNISHDLYRGGRHEMLNEINRADVRENLQRWIDALPRTTI